MSLLQNEIGKAVVGEHNKRQPDSKYFTLALRNSLKILIRILH